MRKNETARLRLVTADDWPSGTSPGDPANVARSVPVQAATGGAVPLAAPKPAKATSADRAPSGAVQSRPAPPPRRHITPSEAKALIDAAGQAGRNGTRDRALLTVIYNHGLRVAEATAMLWHAIDWTTERVWVGRVKRGIEGMHPIPGNELRLLRALKREAGEAGQTDGHVFLSEQGGPMSSDSVQRIVARAGVIAGIGFHVHPHMLRHGRGYALMKSKTDLRTIQAYLGHSQISSTVKYTALDPGRFDGLVRD